MIRKIRYVIETAVEKDRDLADFGVYPGSFVKGGHKYGSIKVPLDLEPASPRDLIETLKVDKLTFLEVADFVKTIRSQFGLPTPSLQCVALTINTLATLREQMAGAAGPWFLSDVRQRVLSNPLAWEAMGLISLVRSSQPGDGSQGH